MEEVRTVDWADEVDTDGVLAVAVSMPVSPSPSQLGSMAVLLSGVAAQVDIERARAAVTDDEPRALLGGDPQGPFVVLRWYSSGEVSTVHHHAWTVINQLHGDGQLERWVDAGDSGPILRATDALTVGDTVVIAERELHRQRAGKQGALELILLGDYSEKRPRVDVLPASAIG